MSYFVLRQIHPPGKSAFVDAATATALALAAIQNQVHKGKYLEWSDPVTSAGPTTLPRQGVSRAL